MESSLDLSGSGEGILEYSCEHGNEYSCSRNFLTNWANISFSRMTPFKGVIIFIIIITNDAFEWHKCFGRLFMYRWIYAAFIRTHQRIACHSLPLPADLGTADWSYLNTMTYSLMWHKFRNQGLPGVASTSLTNITLPDSFFKLEFSLLRLWRISNLEAQGKRTDVNYKTV